MQTQKEERPGCWSSQGVDSSANHTIGRTTMSNVAPLPVSGKSDPVESVYDRLVISMEQAQSILKLIAAVADTESGNGHRPDDRHIRNAAQVADKMLSASFADIDTIYAAGGA